MSPRRRRGRVRSLLDRLRGRGREPEVPDAPEPPPDIGVREPRRPRPSAGSGTAVLEPPPTEEEQS
jgi:hypothetical protein